MENSQITSIFLITSISNIIVSLILQNNIIYSTLVLLLSFTTFGLGVLCEYKFNIVKKIKNFNLKEINETLNKPLIENIDSEAE
jgi:hypothetical protein|tara:strand:+ start:628 stop:879 length:252 start_codon:yes stop_codon:yes gene_type:complete